MSLYAGIEISEILDSMIDCSEYSNIRRNCDTSKLCWFNVGGMADWLYKPLSIEELQKFILNYADKVPIHVIGAGSNIVFCDSHIDGVILRLGKEFNYIEILCEKNALQYLKHVGSMQKHNIESLQNRQYSYKILKVGASTLDLNLALFARDNCISGLEFFAGIPGTVGGAIAMNAGAYGVETKDVLISFKAINLKTAEIKVFGIGEIDFGYRCNPLGREWLFLEAIFIAYSGNKGEIALKIREIQDKRSNTQPVKTKTGGSTFKNPANHSAWKLIDEAGCRGERVGGCTISDLHCNFIINDSTASATNIIELIALVQKKVLKKTGIKLEPEIRIVGRKE